MKRVVYLHGFASGPGSSKARYFQEALTRAGWDVTIPALDGGDFEGLTITGQLRVIEQAVAGEATPLIGSSLGGYLAALYAARHAAISKVVLLAPAFDFASRFKQRAGEGLADWKAAGSAPVYHYAAGREMPIGYGLIEDAEEYEAFPDVRQPCLIFHGRNDEVVPIELSQEFARERSNVRLEAFDSGHELIDALDRMAPAAVEFLEK